MNELSNDYFFLDRYDIQINKLNDSYLIYLLVKTTINKKITHEIHNIISIIQRGSYL